MIGHWARECTNPPDEYAKAKAAALGKGAGGAMAGKSGFVQVGEHEGNHFVTSYDMTKFQDNKEGNHYVTSYDSSNFGEFPTLGMFYKTKSRSEKHPFCGIITEAERGVVDTAAQSGLIGAAALERFNHSLAEHGLKVRQTGKKGQARGVGGQAVSVGVVDLPIGIAGVNGVLEATVIQDDVPLLLPVSLLRSLGCQVDLYTDRLNLAKYGKSTTMKVMPSGHVTVNIMDYDNGAWKLPDEAHRFGLEDSSFRLSNAAVKSSETRKPSTPSNFPVTYHVVMEPSSADQRGHGGCLKPGDTRSVGGPQGPGEPALEEVVVQGDSRDSTIRSTVYWTGPTTRRSFGGGLARKWIAVWLCATLCSGGSTVTVPEVSRAFEQARRVRGDDSPGSASTTSQSIETTDNLSSSVQSPNTQPSRGRQSTSARGVVSGLPEPLEDRDHGASSFHQEDREAQGEGGSHYATEGLYDPRSNAISDYDTGSKHNFSKPCQISARVGSDHQCLGDGTIGDLLRLPKGSKEIHSQEGRSNQGSSLLQVQHGPVRVLHVGSGREGEVEAGTGSDEATGSGSEPRGDETQGGVGRGHPSREGPRERDPEDTGRHDARDEEARTSTPRDTEEHDPRNSRAGTHHNAACRAQAHGVDGTTTTALSAPDGGHAEPTHVDDSSGRRGASFSGDAGPGDACRIAKEGDGTQECAPAATTDPGRSRRGGQLGDVKRDFSDEEMEGILSEAPWAFEVRLGEVTHNTLRKVQLEDQYEPEEDQRVKSVWWAKEEGKAQWIMHSGNLPEKNSPSVERVVAWIDPEAGVADEEEDQVYGTMCKSSRKRLRKNLKELTVSELYSTPRVAQQAQEDGLTAGTSFDLKNGYDFNRSADRKRAMRVLEKENPDLLIVCPPCGPFSPLQELNYPKMKVERAMMMLGEGLGHLQFAMQALEWQIRRGKLGIFEHPERSRAWEEECVRRVQELPGVQIVTGDQCQYGLRVREEEELNRKPTRFLVNSERMAGKLSRRCDNSHSHQALEGGRAKLAEKYPKELCKAMVQGLKEEFKSQFWVFEVEDEADSEGEGNLEDELDEEVERAGQPYRRVQARPEEEEAESEGEEEKEEQGGQVKRGVSEEDKRKLKKLHVNLGHPSREDFTRALRLARAREEIWRYAQKEFKCDVCEAHQKPKLNRPATIPRCYAPGRTVGVDVVYFPGVKPNETIPVLNMTDWGSCYQMLEPLEKTTAEHVWSRFSRSWGRIFGAPELVVVDQGQEFLGDFSKRINEGGSIVQTIGARAPHQQGRTERHGGLAKNMLIKVKDQMPPENREDWEAMIHAVEFAKNRLYNRSGFSAAQRQIGHNLRLPGSLSCDDPFEGTLVRQSAGAEAQKMLKMKELAMEAFIKQTSEDAVKRAAKAKHRVRRDLRQGEIVYVYRKPLARRSIRSPSDTKRAQWVGPGTVIVCEGPNVWIAMRGEVWKCAKEQVRPATMEEEEAHEMLREELEDLREEVSRKSSKRGFKDISRMEWPPEQDEEGEESQEPPRQRARHEEAEPEEDQGASDRADSQQQAAANEDQPSSTSSSSTSSTSQEEPEGEGMQRQEDKEKIHPDQIEQAVRSVIHNEMLDGTSRGSAEGAYGPVKAQVQRMWQKPYPTSYWTALVPDEDEEPITDEVEEGEDEWIFIEERRSLVRVHNQLRKGHFTPRTQKGCPTDLKNLTSSCVQHQLFADGQWKRKQQNWRSKRMTEDGPSRFWCGATEFFLKPGVKAEEISEELLASKSSDEVKDEDISPEEWPKWREADAAEWTKVSNTNAVRTLSAEESEKVVKELQAQGKLERILPSRIVRRWKPAEQPGEEPKRKSRWCVRGDKDPDLLMLDRYAPTATTAVISIALQVGASLGFRCALGDLQNAFMQSDPLRRAQGRLFCKQPPGGLPGLDPRQIVEILAGAYGLGDAPAHWRKTLKRMIVELRYQQSSMDPCLFKLVANGQLQGLLIIEVDDILSLGTPLHYAKMDALQQRLKFGKFKYLDEEKDGTSFNGRRLRVKSGGGFEIDMEKFVSERLKEVEISKERSREKHASVTEEEKSKARASLGALTWAAKEGRPDCCAAASIIAGTLNHMTVQDILDLNKSIKEVRESCALTIPIQPIDVSRMHWGVITDASYANTSGSASQGAFGVICFDEDLWKKGKGKANLIHWKSSKIQRVVNSTLAAEAQSLSKGLSELAWTVTVFNEMVTPDFELKRWEQEIRKRRLHALTKSDMDEDLKKTLCVVDAKSLYDHLVKETIGVTADKRTAIEMQVIRQSMMESGTEIKWVPHGRMTMDCLTKRQGNRAPLIEFLSTGHLNFCQNGQENLVGVCEIQTSIDRLARH